MAISSWNHLKERISFEFQRIKRKGILHILMKVVSKIVSLFLSVILLPLTLALHLAGYRHVTIFTDRIGHLALEPDCLLKEQAMGHIPRHKWIMLAPEKRVANKHLLTYWMNDFSVIQNPILCFIIQGMSKWGLMKYDVSRYIRNIGKAQAAYQIFAEWGDRRALMKLSADDEEYSDEKLQALGIPKGKWFVCVHVREPGFSPVDEELHAHRNASIENVIPAIEEITKRGGWVVRIGDPTMRKLPNMDNVIDYAHHPLKSDQLDIVLCAKSRFILGSTSGIALVGTIFGVPCAIANAIPVSTLWFLKQDLTIPKLIWSSTEQRFLGIGEILQSEIANYQYASLYKMHGLTAIENDSDDILLLTTEMLENLDHTDGCKNHKLNPEIKFSAENYCFGSAASFSRKYIEKHYQIFSDALLM